MRTRRTRTSRGRARALALATLAAGAAAGGCTSQSPGQNGGPPTLGTPAGMWTYVPVPGAKCMDGSDTGVGVNLGTSGDLVLYMEGGGACFNTGTCGSVAHQDGWNASNFHANIDVYNVGVFDRMDPSNPLKDATFVFVPYCTADVHAGSNPTGIGGKMMVGYENVGHDLDLIVPQSKDVTRVIVAGSSAGGFGALINYDRTQAAFGDVPAYLVDDSGPPLSDTYMTPCLQQQFRTAWNLDAAIPAGCTDCTEANGGGMGKAPAWLADHHPQRRLALISSMRDGVIRSFFGYGYPDCASGGTPMPEAAFSAGITELRDQTLTGHDNFRMFTKDSGQHVWLLFELETVSPRSDGTGETLAQWLTDMLDPSKPWDSVAP